MSAIETICDLKLSIADARHLTRTHGPDIGLQTLDIAHAYEREIARMILKHRRSLNIGDYGEFVAVVEISAWGSG